MTHGKQSSRFILLLLSISISIIPTLSLTIQAPANTEHISGLKKTFCSYWRQWYVFRKDVVYPINYYVTLFNIFNNDPEPNKLDIVRTAIGYIDNPTLDIIQNQEITNAAAKVAIGIVDAILAEKPAEYIVKDDIVHSICNHGCAIALNLIANTITDNSKSQALNNQASNTVKFFAINYCANKIGAIISKPIGNIAFKAIRCYKHGRKPADQCEW